MMSLLFGVGIGLGSLAVGLVMGCGSAGDASELVLRLWKAMVRSMMQRQMSHSDMLGGIESPSCDQARHSGQCEDERD